MSQVLGAYGKGYQSGLNGYSQETCPYEEETTAYWQWVDGWNKAVAFWEDREEDTGLTQWQAMLALV